MIIAAFSDVHAVLPAWNAFLNQTASQNVSAYWCLGDTVGYGPHPIETLGAVRELIDQNSENLYIIGNHDAVAAGTIRTGKSVGAEDVGLSGIRLDAERLASSHQFHINNAAPELLEWLRRKAVTQLEVEAYKGVYLAHGAYINPDESAKDKVTPNHNSSSRWRYATSNVLTAATQVTQINTWHQTKLRLVLYGHYHVPALLRYDYDTFKATPEKFSFNEWITLDGLDKHPVLINVGSLALPRKRVDDDNSCLPSTYLLLDLPDKTDAPLDAIRVCFCTNPYDWTGMVNDESLFHDLYIMRDEVLSQIRNSCLPDGISNSPK